MKHKHTRREKGQALFLAALMVLSVFAMSASFAGMAAASQDFEVSITDTNSPVTEGDGLEVTVEVTNTNTEEEQTGDVSLDFDDQTEVDTETVTVAAGSTDEITLTYQTTEGDAGENIDVTVNSDADSDTTQVTVEEAADEGSISGEVIDTDGDAIEGATVTAVDENGNESDAEADSNGSYEISNLADGEYTVEAGASGFVSASDNVTVSNGEATENVDFELDAPSTVFNDQVSDDGTTVTVDEVYLPEDGFVAIHSDPIADEDEGITPADSVVGVSEPLDEGTHDNVEVTLFGDNVVGADFDQDSLEEGQLLHAMPHVDEPNDDEYRFVETSNDGGQEVEDLPFFDQDGDILGMDMAFVSLQDGDAVATSDTTYWQGQDLFFVADDGSDSADETFQLRTDDEDESLVTEFTLDEDGVAIISTSGLEGNYKIVDENGDDQRTDMEVAVQNLDAEFNPDSVLESSDSSENAELILDSNRGSYSVEVSSDDLSDSELNSIFGEDVEDGSVMLSSSDTDADFSEIDPGEYNVTVEVTDTDAEANATMDVTEFDDDISFVDSVYSEEAGDIAEISVDLGDSDSGTVFVGDEDIGYLVAVEITDAGDEDEVTIDMNTFLAGNTDEGEDLPENLFTTEYDVELNTLSVEDLDDWNGDDFNASEFDASSNLDSSIEAGDYDLRLSTDATINNDDDVENEQDVATLALGDRSTDDIASGVAPADADIEDADDVWEYVTERDEVVLGDNLVIGVEASGIHGLLADADDNEIGELAENGDLSLEIEQQNPSANRDAIEIDLANSNAEFHSDADNDTFFVVMDTEQLEDMDDNRDVDVGQEYTATFTVNEGYYGLDDDEEVSTDFWLAEAEGEYDNIVEDDDGNEWLEVEQSENATITGETNVAPGTEMEIRNRASGGFLMTENVEIQSDGAFEGTFDFSAEDVDTEFVSQLIHDDDLVNTNAIVVESTEPEQDPHTVTITVEDADGEPVSGAEVEVSNDDTWTETTDANGEAVFELAHGEYDVTATHDGEEASGSLTVDDETPDSGTLTLGEEDQQIPEEDDDGVDDGVDDYDDADDGVDDDAAPDDDGANADDDDAADDTEDQPGFGIAVALIALLAAAGIALRNRA
jgi:pilus assembly protein FimV